MGNPSEKPPGRDWLAWRETFSAGTLLILLMALASTVAVFAWPIPERPGMEMWTFARSHALMYEPVIKQWNADRPMPVNMFVISGDALTRRMMSAFFSDTPVADMIEAERTMASSAFTGPLEDVGFVDLTDRLHETGLYDQLNEPSFGPWSSRGRIFGLPHDVHPVMLAYRADIVEQAGIDVSRIETWDDFVRAFRPLVKDLDGDGRPDRYALNIWQTSADQLELLILQAGGSFFDADGKSVIGSPENARVLATIVSWIAGPNRIAADAPEFSASGNELRLQGYVVASFMPDWLGGVWKTDLPGLKGKIKLMPLPAWDKGGRRTSVWGGTMLGIPRAAKHPQQAWEFAQYLYLSETIAKTLYEQTGIITPVKRLWANDFYDKPDPFFCGQAPGRQYINLAPDVPRRTSSPFNNLAKARTCDALIALRQYAIEHNTYDVPALIPVAHRLLADAQNLVQTQMDRNVFLKTPPATTQESQK